MISTITPTSGMFTNTATDPKLSTEQADKLNDILSNFDTEDLNGDTASKIVTEIGEAGISAGAGLTSALAENGIDARALGDLAGVTGPGAAGGPPGGGPPGGGPLGGGGPGGVGGPSGGGGATSVDDAVVSLFEEAASIYEADETGQTFAEILAERMESEGLTYNQPLVDFRA